MTMLSVEVKNCRQCLFRGHYKKRHICLATRIGENVGSPIKLPTMILDEYVPETLERDASYPEPPEWCPLRLVYIVVGREGQIPDRVTTIGSLWPPNIGGPLSEKQARKLMYPDEEER